MFKIQSRRVNNIFFVIAIFMLSVIVIAQPSVTYAASVTSSPIGVVNYKLLIDQHPDTVQANATYQAAIKQAQDDFNTKSANMNDNEKKALYQQLQQGIHQKQLELLGAIRDKVNAAVKAVADAKGLTIVVDKSDTVYGGQDITDEVMKKIGK